MPRSVRVFVYLGLLVFVPFLAFGFDLQSEAAGGLVGIGHAVAWGGGTFLVMLTLVASIEVARQWHA